MDDLDCAANLEALQRELSLKCIAANSRHHLTSLTHCKACQEPIPTQRQALGGIERCIDCERDFEREQKQQGFRR